ncbi:MAG: WecB/TagA/CpsF family glycosyltransferase [Negativicutes bacterium]|jgi:N-acetylglucosaminyldiphosphoundecaprenol N-acetyl-beta-D-mannosaminyltransferase
MNKNRVEILGVGIDPVTMNEAVAFCEKQIVSRVPAEIITANAEMIMQANTNPQLLKAMLNAALVIPDGAGVILAAKYFGLAIPERVAGYDLSQELLKLAAKKNFRVFFLGAAPGVANQAKTAAEAKYAGLQIVGVENGYFAPNEQEAVIEAVTKAQPDILLVALGVPRQELWLEEHLQVLGVPVCIGVGGTFDVMAGIVKRAPLWMQRIHLEWAYRLIMQPWRIIRMMNLPKFAFKVLISKLNG